MGIRYCTSKGWEGKRDPGHCIPILHGTCAVYKDTIPANKSRSLRVFMVLVPSLAASRRLPWALPGFCIRIKVTAQRHTNVFLTMVTSVCVDVRSYFHVPKKQNLGTLLFPKARSQDKKIDSTNTRVEILWIESSVFNIHVLLPEKS